MKIVKAVHSTNQEYKGNLVKQSVENGWMGFLGGGKDKNKANNLILTYQRLTEKTHYRLGYTLKSQKRF